MRRIPERARRALRRLLAAGAALAFACGGDSPPSADPGTAAAGAGATGGPPRLERVVLRPAAPTRAEPLRLEVAVVDPDRDAVALEVEWLRNGVELRRGPELSLDTAELRQGDRVAARVVASDGVHRVEGRSDEVLIGNTPPRITSLDLLPEEPTGADALLVAVEAQDPDGDEVSYRFEWWRNDAPIAAAAGPTLDPALVSRGEEIWVRVTPSDGTDEGEPLRSRARLVRNAAPRITSQPSYQVSGPNLYEYTVKAEDPDGDRPLRFELLEGPAGMELDLVSGHLSWVVPPSAGGQYTIELAVRDPLGGETRQRYALRLAWEQPEAPATEAPATPATPE